MRRRLDYAESMKSHAVLSSKAKMVQGEAVLELNAGTVLELSRQNRRPLYAA